jgi:hypothetical protein
MSAPVKVDWVVQELRVSCSGDGVDIRLFDVGGGPAKVLMPTKRGISIPGSMIPGLIKALQVAEAKARELGLIGGAA